MNTTTFTDFDDRPHADADHKGGRYHSNEPNLLIQVLSVIAFGVFSIVAVAMAFTAFWIAGLVVTLMIAWTWAGSRMFGGRRSKRQRAVRQAVSDLAPPVLDQRASGNASFNAYRSEVLDRMERESRDFDSFVARLREARDASEFDGFMDDRAQIAKDARAKNDGTHDSDSVEA